MSRHNTKLPTDPFVCPHCGADATKLRMLAGALDALDKRKIFTKNLGRATSDREVQEDLNTWADNISPLDP